MSFLYILSHFGSSLNKKVTRWGGYSIVGSP